MTSITDLLKNNPKPSVRQECNLMLDITTPNFTFIFPFKYKIVNSLKLTAYSVKGVPVTGGVPNYTFLNLKFNEFERYDWIRSDQQIMPAIPLTGLFTHEHLEEPIELIPFGVNKSVNTLTLTVTNPDFTPGSFTELVLWMKFVYQS